MVDLTIDTDKTAGEIISFIRKKVTSAGFKKVIIGLSGGLDSSTSFALAIKAIGIANIKAVSLPYGEWQKEAVSQVKDLIGFYNLPADNLIARDIKPLIAPLLETESDMNDLRKGNIIVRARMIILYDLAKKHEALVMGTENKTEYLLGYFTRFGDEASDVEPLRGLYKTQVRQLAQFIKVPDKIIQKTPTAGMWPGQTDEGEFGFSYREADQILFLAVEKKLSEKEIIKKGFAEKLVKKVLGRMKVNEFKHLLPYKLIF